MSYFIHDVESYPNVFTCTFIDVYTGECTVYEISDRRDDSAYFRTFIEMCQREGHVFVGFNNVGYDYPVIHHLMTSECMTAEIAYYKTMQIINTPWDDRFSNVVWESEVMVPQVDLFKIHHFDNFARATSLKKLEFAMGSKNLRDLPFPPGTHLTSAQIDVLIEYNIHDCMETWRFMLASEDQLKFRRGLSKKYNRNFMNHNDTKIGKDYFIMELEKAGVACYTQNPRKPIQTHRSPIHLADAVLHWINFDHPEFNRILNWIKSQSIYETKGVFDDVNCTVNDFTFDFGTGGIHGSVSSRAIQSDGDFIILDLDVTSFYPKLAITNRFYPEHLSEKFCDIYEDVFQQRISYPKGTTENAMLKLALNGVYGDSNNVYSPFYDPLYTMKITINGQLLLCMLAEQLMAIPDLEMIQINTDGMTVRVPRNSWGLLHMETDLWETRTGLNLEENEYSRMFIRDVNNYIAVYTDGKLKRKGAYKYGDDLEWHQDHGGQVIAKAAEHAMLTGGSVRKFIETHENTRDFHLLAKVNRDCKLMWVDGEGAAVSELQRISRYYASTKGGFLVKNMPPLAKNPEKWREISIDAGWKTWIINDLDDFGPAINYEYYISQAEKLVIK